MGEILDELLRRKLDGELGRPRRRSSTRPGSCWPRSPRERRLETFLYLAPVMLAQPDAARAGARVVATKLGDPTPREQGRLTLNPLPHLDPLGTAMFAITYFLTGFIFGWAKPVLVDPRYFRRPKERWRSWPRPARPTNFLLATGLRRDRHPRRINLGSEDRRRCSSYAYRVNVVLGIFNLIPIPPLDGSRIVGAVMTDATYARWARSTSTA